jgi:hypothetical protein
MSHLDLISSGKPADYRELGHRVLREHQLLGESLTTIRSNFLWQLQKKDIKEVPKKIMQAAVELAEKRLIEASDAHKDLGQPLDDDNIDKDDKKVAVGGSLWRKTSRSEPGGK